MDKDHSVRVCLGGTFSPLHRGHLDLLERAFQVGDVVLLGLTSDRFASLHRTREIMSYQDRRSNLERVLGYLGKRYGNKYEILTIDDPVGFADRPEIDMIVVSEETEKGADMINESRISRGLEPLKKIVVEMRTDHSGRRISSTSIRSGEMDVGYMLDNGTKYQSGGEKDGS